MEAVGIRRHHRSIRIYDLVCIGILVLSAVILYVLFMLRDGGSWLGVISAFSVYCTAFLVFCVTGARTQIVVGGVLMSLVPSIAFALSLSHVAIVIIAGLFVWRGIVHIRKQLLGSIEIHVVRAMSAGILSFLVGMSLLLSSLHYTVVTQLKPSAVLGGIVDSQVRTLQSVGSLISNSGIGTEGNNTKSKDVTVDDFLTGLITADNAVDGAEQKSTQEGDVIGGIASLFGLDASLLGGQAAALGADALGGAQELIVERMRSQLAENLGGDLSGSESIFEVLTQLVTIKTAEAINGNPVLTSFLPLVLSFFFFLTVFSLASLARFVWIWLAGLIFLLLKTYGFVKVIKVQKVVDAIKY